MRKINEIIASKRIHENEINCIMHRLNERKQIPDEFWEEVNEFRLDESQNEKGKKWLRTKLLKKNGEPTKYAIENGLEWVAERVERIDNFRIVDYFNIGDFMPLFRPVYQANDVNSECLFSYISKVGDMEIY